MYFVYFFVLSFACKFFLAYTYVLFMYTAVNLSLVSLNVRGIREQTKRKSIFSHQKDKRADVYFLQKTYSEPADGKKNGVAKSSFPIALPIAKECAL